MKECEICGHSSKDHVLDDYGGIDISSYYLCWHSDKTGKLCKCTGYTNGDSKMLYEEKYNPSSLADIILKRLKEERETTTPSERFQKMIDRGIIDKEGKVIVPSEREETKRMDNWIPKIGDKVVIVEHEYYCGQKGTISEIDDDFVDEYTIHVPKIGGFVKYLKKSQIKLYVDYKFDPECSTRLNSDKPKDSCSSEKLTGDKDFDKILSECIKLLETKGHDYTQGNSDKLHNFKTVGEWLDIPPEKVLGVYLYKHVSALFSFIKTGKVASEPIESRLVDIINYCLLAGKMFNEKDSR